MDWFLLVDQESDHRWDAITYLYTTHLRTALPMLRSSSCTQKISNSLQGLCTLFNCTKAY
jgi:hypothetical protein